MRGALMRPRVRGVAALFALLAAGALACRGDGPSPPPVTGSLAVEQVASGLTDPIALASLPGDGRLFVAEQIGTIRIVRDGVVDPTPFLDLRSRILAENERGLLGLAFHPDHADNGWVYVSFTDLSGDSRIERYTVSADPDVVDPQSMLLILAQDQPQANHNGGQIVFGPDGMLYIFFGDGGGSGDPQGNAQNLNTLLGKMLRVDVDGAAPYEIPTSNPFRGQAGRRDEIWAYGLRNPWRNAFDRVGGRLYIADVGQNELEEVDVVEWNAAGVNYGWNRMEGSSCFEPSTGCDQTGLTLPILEYDHDDGCSITGGHVYRGSAIPGIYGHYFYSDFCRGWLRSFRYLNGEAVDRRSWDIGNIGNVLSFGEDASGELYILSSNGSVYRIVEPE